MKNNLFQKVPLAMFIAILFLSCAASPSIAFAETLEDDEPTPEGEIPTTYTTEAGGACANAFYPLLSNMTWQYNITIGEEDSERGQETFSTSISFKDITDDSFISVQTSGDQSNDVSWSCTDEGLLSSTYFNMNMSPSQAMDFETFEVEGVALPPEAEWEKGKFWDVDYKIQITMRRPDSDEETQTEGEISLSREITGKDIITVPAGTFEDAYRVESTGVMTTTMPDGNEASMPLMYTDWYVKGIGLVKTATADANMSYSMELASLE